jgi:hypothetical protein
VLPTLNGRIQTRIFLIVVIGGIWTLIVTPFVRLFIEGDPTLGDTYRVTFEILLLTLVLGIIWEFIYEGLMQFRWEKDWPAFFQFFQGIPEGISTWLLLHVDAFNPLPGNPVPGPAFVILFVTTWIVTWLMANGPMKILFLRWRFSGGRLF